MSNVPCKLSITYVYCFAQFLCIIICSWASNLMYYTFSPYFFIVYNYYNAVNASVLKYFNNLFCIVVDIEMKFNSFKYIMVWEQSQTFCVKYCAVAAWQNNSSDHILCVCQVEELNLPLKRNQAYVMKYFMQCRTEVAYVIDQPKDRRYISSESLLNTPQ